MVFLSNERFQSLQLILSEVFLLHALTSSKAYVQDVLPGSPLYKTKEEDGCCQVPTMSLRFLLIDNDMGFGSVFYTL